MILLPMITVHQGFYIFFYLPSLIFLVITVKE